MRLPPPPNDHTCQILNIHKMATGNRIDICTFKNRHMLLTHLDYQSKEVKRIFKKSVSLVSVFE